MKILTLDVSKKSTGWAVDGSGGPPLHGSYTGAANFTNGLAIVQFSRWIYKMAGTHQPNMIAVERPIYSSTNKNIHVTQDTSIVIILAGMAMATAADMNILFTDFDVRTARKHCIGKGGQKRGADAKQLIFDWCKMLNWHPANFDESDAMAGWCYAKATNDPSFRPETGTPLFRSHSGGNDANARTPST